MQTFQSFQTPGLFQQFSWNKPGPTPKRRKDGLLDERIFESAQSTNQSLEEQVRKLEMSITKMENRIKLVLAESAQKQAVIKQRLSILEARIRARNPYDDTDDDIYLYERDQEIPFEYNDQIAPRTTVQAIGRQYRERGQSLSPDRGEEPSQATSERRNNSLRRNKKTSKSTGPRD